MLGYRFPQDAAYFLSRAKENAASRVWAGIHFTSDYTSGVAMGQAVGRTVIESPKPTEAEPATARRNGSYLTAMGVAMPSPVCPGLQVTV